MAGNIITVGFLFYVGLTIVNGLVAREKGRFALGVVVLSVFFAPFVYLYLLAVPEKGK